MQHYIFPTEGITQKGDEYYATESRQWMPAFIGVQVSKDVRRPVPSAEWVSVKERMPTKEDADEDGLVLVCHTGQKDMQSQANTIPWNHNAALRDHGFWMKIPEAPQPEQDDAFEKAWLLEGTSSLCAKEQARHFWNAALAAGKEEA